MLSVPTAALAQKSDTFSLNRPGKSETSLLKTEPYVVTATRTEKLLSDAVGSLAVISDLEITEREPNVLTQLIEDIPNIDVACPTDLFFSKISIRDSSEKRVTYLIDGMQMADSSMSGSHPSGIFLDPTMVKQVEVRRGGGSTLFGHGGIGGTINVQTKNASDFLPAGETWGAKAHVGYNSGNESWLKNAAVYGRTDTVEGLFAVSHRKGAVPYYADEDKRKKGKFTSHTTSVMAKGSFKPVNGVTLSAAYNYDNADNSRPIEYTQHRLNGTLSAIDGDWLDLIASVQYVRSDHLFNLTLPFGTLSNDTHFNSVEVSVQNTSLLHLAGEHLLTYGLDLTVARQHGETRSNRKPWHKDPLRPNAKDTRYAAFIQDEYTINNYLSVMPSLRASRYRITSDEGFETHTGDSINPGVTLSLKPVNGLTTWLSFNTGYRAPMMDELFMRATLRNSDIVLPNPDLKPESSKNYEFGVMVKRDRLFTEADTFSTRAVVFYDDVKDYIEVAPVDMSDPANQTAFEDVCHPNQRCWYSQNHDHVSKKGVELSGRYRWKNLSINASYGYLSITDKNTREKRIGYTPQSATLRVAYDIPTWHFSPWYRASWHHSAKADQFAFIPGVGPATVRVTMPSYLTHSIGFIWEPLAKGRQSFSISANVENVFNKKYSLIKAGSSDFARTFNIRVNATF